MNRKNVIVALMLALLSVSCGCAKNGEEKVKILMVVPPVQIMDVEYNEPRMLFDNKGADVKVASTTMDEVTGSDLRIKPDLLISEAKAADYDAIVLIGGMGIFAHILGNVDLINLVREMRASDKYVCAICGSSAVLAKAGILNGVKATTYPEKALIGELEKGGAVYLPDVTVVSGKIVTGNGPGAAAEFATKVAETIGL